MYPVYSATQDERALHSVIVQFSQKATLKAQATCTMLSHMGIVRMIAYKPGIVTKGYSTSCVMTLSSSPLPIVQLRGTRLEIVGIAGYKQ